MRDLRSALCWIHSNSKSFRGKVTEPAVLQMSAEVQQEVLKEALESPSLEAMDPFAFIFQTQQDMEYFLSNCHDEMGLKVNCMFK